MSTEQDIDDMAVFLAEFEAAFAILIERRDDAYTKAIAPLDDEIQKLAAEESKIDEAAGNLESLLAAKEREARRQADVLLLAGKQEEAQAKLAEAEAARNAPGAMLQRKGEIEARYQAIEDEKQGAARRVAEAWWAECSQVTRAAEHGYLVTLLDGLKQSLSEFKQRTGIVAYDSRFRDIHVRDLTADGDSEEWRVGCDLYQRHYPVRVRVTGERGRP